MNGRWAVGGLRASERARTDGEQTHRGQKERLKDDDEGRNRGRANGSMVWSAEGVRPERKGTRNGTVGAKKQA